MKIINNSKIIPTVFLLLIVLSSILFYFKVYLKSDYQYIKFIPGENIVKSILLSDSTDYLNYKKNILNKNLYNYVIDKANKISDKKLKNEFLYLNFYNNNENWNRDFPWKYKEVFNLDNIIEPITTYNQILIKDSYLYKKLASIASIYTNSDQQHINLYGDKNDFYAKNININSNTPIDFANYKNILFNGEYHFDFFINTPLVNEEKYSVYHAYWDSELVKQPYNIDYSSLKECRNNGYYQINIDEFAKIEDNPYILALVNAVNDARKLYCFNYLEINKIDYMLETNYMSVKEKLRLLGIRSKLVVN